MKINYIDVKAAFDKAQAIVAVRDAAQRVVDLEGRDEKVVEVLINTDSASSLKDLLTPKPTKVQYVIAFKSSYDGRVSTGEQLGHPRNHTFDTLEGAADEITYLRNSTSVGQYYFVVEKTVEA